MVITIKEEINNKHHEEIPENKKYFTKIYTVLSKDIREKLKKLNVSKKKKKKIRRELAFLPKKKQNDYLDEFK